jgi:hypothetical protein
MSTADPADRAKADRASHAEDEPEDALYCAACGFDALNENECTECGGTTLVVKNHGLLDRFRKRFLLP